MFTLDWFPHLLYLTSVNCDDGIPVQCITKQHNLLLSPSESSRASDEVGIPAGRGLIRLIIVLKTNYFVCFLYSLNTDRIRGVLNVQGAHAIFFETLKCARINDTSRVIRNPTIYICENKGAEQLRCNRAADQGICFGYIDTVFPLLPKLEISASSDFLWLYSPVCVGPGWIPPNTGFGRKFVSS